MRAIADKLKLEKDVAIESKMLSRMIESAQRKVEGHNYDIRKQLLEFDDVQNDQRREIYRLRNEILENNDVAEGMKELRHGYFEKLFRTYVPAETVEEQWDLDTLTKILKEQWGIDIPMQAMLEESNEVTDEDLLNKLIEETDRIVREKEEIVGHESWTSFSKSVLLQMIDSMWRQHIQALDALRMGVFLRSYAAKQPKQEYKREAFAMFETLLDSISESVSRILMRVQIQVESDSAETIEAQKREAEKAGIDFSNVGRNDPCPCGSGKKYKDCHGRLA